MQDKTFLPHCVIENLPGACMRTIGLLAVQTGVGHRCPFSIVFESLSPLSCSLMEGLGGTICLHCDLLHPEMATFPGYEGDI